MLPKHTKTSALALIAALAFAAAFLVSWWQDSQRAGSSAGRMASQLVLLIRAGDDMAVIDWVGAMNGSPDILALRVESGGRTIASTGDPSRFPIPSLGAFAHRFPSLWLSRLPLNGDSIPAEMVLVERLSPGPWVWGFLAALGSLFIVLPFKRMTSMEPGTVVRSSSEPLVSAFEDAPRVPKAGVSLSEMFLRDIAERSGECLICLDSRYQVQWVSPKTASLLQRKEDEFAGFHLLDLEPSPELVVAVEENHPTATVQGPFPGRPVLKAEIDKTTYGFLLKLHPG